MKRFCLFLLLICPLPGICQTGAKTQQQSKINGLWRNNEFGYQSYDGARLYYNSHTQGTGSHSLEKRNHPKNTDPMIVLNGRIFVPFFNKPQW